MLFDVREDLRHSGRETVRSIAFLPTVFVLVALVAGYVLSRVQPPSSPMLDWLVFRGSATAARELLIVVSGTMITVTGLVFALTVVALQIASTQFSVRLLRTFLQDAGTRAVLGVFVATFAYSLGGLFTVGQANEDGVDFVPRLAVTGSLILALLSVGMLVYFIQHLTNSIRIDTVMLRVETETRRAIARRFPDPIGNDSPPRPRPVPAADATVIATRRSGYVQGFNVDALVRLARRHGVTIQLRPEVGYHVVAGTPLAWIRPHPSADPAGVAADGAGESGAIDTEAIAVGINREVAIHRERSLDDDVVFGIRQLIDIAMRAVAPSVNDPYTAAQAIHHLTVVVADLAGRAIPDIHRDDGDHLRLFIPVPRFETYLDIITDHLRRSAGDRPRVVFELLRLLETVAVVGTSKSRRLATIERIDRIEADSELLIRAALDQEAISAAAERARESARTGVMQPGF